MSCGVPIVSSAVGGMPDTGVGDGPGRLIPPRNPQRCADPDNPILSNRRLRTSLGRAGRRRVEERYSWERVAEETAAIYDRLAGAAP